MKTIAILGLCASLTASGVAQANNKNIVETAVAAGSFKTLAAALGAADLADALQSKGPFTVFAPTDEAFAKLPKGTVEDLLKPENKAKLQAILKYHVVAGDIPLSKALSAKSAETLQGDSVDIRFKNGKVMINQASLQTADVKTSNGVIHIIDQVLLPPAPKNDIAGVAKKAGQFETLLAAAEAAGITDALTGAKPLTVLAPTDEAFAALPKGTVETLLKPENMDKLKAILLYHVVPGSVSAGDALNAKAAKTLGGQKVNFAIKNGKFLVNESNILITDIKADNGVIHVIDQVLIPSVKASTRIEQAINMGVPVFNHGNHHKCSEIYMSCVKALAMDPDLCKSTRSSMSALIKQASRMHSSTDRAWALRHGMDRVYASLNR